MSENSDEADKIHEPTPKRLDDARRKGQVVRSADVTMAAAHAGFLLVFAVWGAATVSELGSKMMAMFSQVGSLATAPLGGAFSALVQAALIDTVRVTAPWFAVPALAALAAVIAQRAFTVTGSNLEPKMSRISPLANARNKFGANGLFEFAKSTAKLVIYSVVLGLFLVDRIKVLTALPYAEPGPALVLMADILLELMWRVLVVAIVIATIDYLWQYHAHIKRQRMTLQELKDEMKESDGDPAMKQHRRARALELASQKVAAEVPKADVVIVNPTHYAVALKWSRQRGSAPVCVAKGVDEMALRIRTLAQASGIPVHSDPQTARTLYATVNVGQEIATEHYQAVAVAIRFAEDMRKRARRWT